ncbi:hypothetical protein FVEN_g17 [Fusarium venenatum]|uniref:Endoglucanase n=1 Tax=Fusarium venenatum TaxID=56646 RepID=A0A2L2TTN8_9HYPO|nr:uncharacterized protein FVRRES_07901 [Fusarium venenatum]KAG8362183.1 hypothetical protein FVEN_g17 [Fusarium venenatum]KAH6994784.1 endoglucanase [Fusarium venenatum]CEI63465.1 unnamed protein product [Fusarium venenatum]
MKSTLLLAGAFAPFALAESLCEQYGYLANDGYAFNNNAWGKDSGSGDQCTYVDWSNSNGAAWHVEWNWSGGQDSVKSYPNSALQIGTDKKIVSSITNMQSTAEWTYSGDSIRADVAYDLFTAADPNHDTSSGEYELMVWLARYGEVQPIGTLQTSVTIEGHTWELWVGMNGSMKVFSFVAPTPVNDFNADIKQFYDYLAKSQNYPASEQYLLTFHFGTEPFTGENAKFSVTNFNAHLK